MNSECYIDLLYRGTREGYSLLGGARERMDGVSPGRLQSFRHRPRQVDDRSPGRGGMVKQSILKKGLYTP